MWVMLNDCFLSIVKKSCGRDELLVRAPRRAGDIEKVFHGAKVRRTPFPADYLYRAEVKVKDLAAALGREAQRIDYDNFKDSVQDDDLHDAYLRVWMSMQMLQQNARDKVFS